MILDLPGNIVPGAGCSGGRRALGFICGAHTAAIARPGLAFEAPWRSEGHGGWQSQSKAALLEQLQDSQVAVEQLHNQIQPQPDKLQRDGLSQSLQYMLESQHLALEMLLQECQALKAQVRQYKALTQEQERECSLQAERDQHTWEQLSRTESYVHALESSLDLYKKKYQAALVQVGELESQIQHLEEEARVPEHAEKQILLEDLWSKGQAEDNPGQLKEEQHHAQEKGQSVQLTCQQDKTLQELQVELAASHAKLLQQREGLASLHREFASYKLTHSYSDTNYRSRLLSQEVLRQKLQQMEEGWQQQAEEYWALVQDLKLELSREAEQSSSTVKDLARLELAVQSLCQEAAAEQNRQQRELATAQHRVHQAQGLLRQSRQLCAQKERAIQKRDRLLQRARASHSIVQELAQADPVSAALPEAKRGRAQHASQRARAPVLRQRRPKNPAWQQQAAAAAAMEAAQDQLDLRRRGQVGCLLGALPGRGHTAEAELAQESFLAGHGPPAAREVLQGPVEELSRCKQQPLQAASTLELETLQQQLQEKEWRVQGLQACVMKQKAENCLLQDQLTQQMAVLRLVHGNFRRAQRQLKEQAAKIESLQISLEASHAGNHWLHQESELVVANVRQWVEQQKQVNEKLGHKLRTQIKQIAQVTGERDLLHELVERLQEYNQGLKNEANEKHIICERIKALHNSDLEPHAVLKQLWRILLL